MLYTYFRNWIGGDTFQKISLIVLPYIATAIRYCQSIPTQARLLAQKISVSPARVIPYHDEQILEISYRIGDQKYVIITNPGVNDEKKIVYAAIETHDKDYIITDILISLYGPNGDFHDARFTPEEIMQLYFPDEFKGEDTIRHELLVIMTSSQINNITFVPFTDTIPLRNHLK